MTSSTLLLTCFESCQRPFCLVKLFGFYAEDILAVLCSLVISVRGFKHVLTDLQVVHHNRHECPPWINNPTLSDGCTSFIDVLYSGAIMDVMLAAFVLRIKFSLNRCIVYAAPDSQHKLLRLLDELLCS